MKKIADNTIKFKLYSPIAAVMTGEKGLQTLTGADLLPYRDAIQAALDSVPVPKEQGLMAYFTGMPSVGKKVRALHPAVEELDGKLWGVAVCEASEFLSNAEIYELKSFCEGQYGNAWGDVVRMRKQAVPGGDLEVRFWQSNAFRMKTEREMGLVKPPADKTTITHIDKDSFWALIAESKQCCGQNTELAADWLCEQLQALPPEEIVRFDAFFHRFQNEADRYGLWSAACVMRDGCSDDGFMDFRAWLVGQGKEVYLSALKDPDTLANFDLQGDCLCESMGYVASRAYEEKTEGGDLYSVKLSEELKQELHEAGNEAVCGEVTRIPMEWADMPKYLPKLCVKYRTPEELRFRSRFPMWNYGSPAIQAAFRAVGKQIPKEKQNRGGKDR